MKTQYKLLLTVGGVYILTLGFIHRGAPSLRNEVDPNLVRVNNITSADEDAADESVVYKLSWKSKDNVFFKKVKQGNEGTADNNPVAEDEKKECDGMNTGWLGKPVFEKVSDGLHIFSAYFDERLPINYIRILGIVKTNKGKVDPKLFRNNFCMFKLDTADNSTTFVTVAMTFYEMCENHKRVYGGWIMSCEVPPSIRNVPKSLRIYSGRGNVTDLRNSKEFCVRSYGKNIDKRKLSYGVCVPPIYGQVKPKEVIEFIELNRILGAEKFIFYVELSESTISLDVQRVLRYYSSLNIVHLIDWPLPIRTELIWYHGQSLAINDCLYRHMNDFDHLLFVDLDEFIVPQKDMSTWDEIMTQLEKNDANSFFQASGFSFWSTYFSPDFSRKVFSSEMGTVSRTNRTRYFSYRRTKVIVRPDRVFEMGIHHVSRSWPDSRNYTVWTVPTKIAFIHHYRTCVREFGIPCSVVIPDYTVATKYGQQIKDNYLKILYDITY